MPVGGKHKAVAVVTGVLAAPILRPIVDRLDQVDGLRVSLVVVKNRVFGPTVTVSGLLCGRDILETLLECRRADLYLLPANCLRPWDRLFLDDLSLEELRTRLARPVHALDGTCRELAGAILADEGSARPGSI